MSSSFHATKFKTQYVGTLPPEDERIDELRSWCAEFHRLNLTPLHKYGACGNLSFRMVPGGLPFIVTASGTRFDGPIPAENFVIVDSCNLDEGVVFAKGARKPSSESMFHFAIYRQREDVNAVFHGHSREILASASGLGLPETRREEPYGTVALVRSILEVLGNENFLIIRNHGFLSLGATMREAGERALHICRKSL